LESVAPISAVKRLRSPPRAQYQSVHGSSLEARGEFLLARDQLSVRDHQLKRGLEQAKHFVERRRVVTTLFQPSDAIALQSDPLQGVSDVLISQFEFLARQWH
jgi:hypothetical protein